MTETAHDDWIAAHTSGIYLHRSGHGGTAPTVILEAGLAGCSTSWNRVIALIAPYADVIAYDRAGHGYSPNPPSMRPRSPTWIAGQLHDALRAATIPGPYLLVGHSAGAIYCRAFAARFPNQTAGLVLVDPSLPPRPDAATPATRWMVPLVHPLTVAAIARLARRRRSSPQPPVRHTSVRHGRPSEWVRGSTWMAMIHEIRGLSQLRRESANPPTDKPIVVITQAAPRRTAGVAAYAWNRLAASHHALTASAPRGKHLVAAHAGHAIPSQEPQVVAAAVVHLLAEQPDARYGRPSALAARPPIA
jgi:pimeloyl-ACP methyl ester carboxylesterase